MTSGICRSFIESVSHTRMNDSLVHPSVLTISAHADDHVMPAGTLFKLKSQGYHLYEALLTDSGDGRDFRDQFLVNGLAELRQSEFLAATKLLGTKKVFEFHQPDLCLEVSRDLILGLVNIIRQVKPQTVILHHWHDWHRDHIAAHQLGVEAVKLAASGIQPELGQPWRVPQLLAAEGAYSIQPDILVDVTDFAQLKLELWAHYASQATPEETEYIASLLKVRGYQMRNGHTHLAEGFSIIQQSPLQLFDEL